jgi:uncharacterized protein YrrD
MSVSPGDLKAGIDVYSSDGHKLGQLHRAVLRRADLSLTHVVVDIGFLRSGRRLWEGGLGLDYDRIVPAADVVNADDERLLLALTAEQFKFAPEYTQESFESPWDLSPGEFDIPDVVNRAQGLAGLIGNTANVWVVERLNKPLGSVDIAEGTPVWRGSPHQKLGEVRRLLFGGDGSLQALVIERGFLLHRDVVLPVRYIVELMDDLIRVDITDEQLEQLREYRDDER